MKVIIAGGGTGGHIFPGMAIAEDFLKRDPQNHILMVGAEGGLEERIWSEQKIQYQLIASGKFAGEPLTVRVRSAIKVLKGIWQAIKLIREFQPQFILGVGGYASFPMLVAGFILRVPRGIQEQNSFPGMANRLLSRISNKVFLSFESAKPHFRGVKPEKFVLSGNPLRKKVKDELSKAIEPDEKNSRFQILVVGGSQGARRLNKLMMTAVEYLIPIRDKIKIVHMSGSVDQYDLILTYSKKGFRAKVYQFIEDIGKELRLADMVVSRSGAGAVFEIALAGKPSILIPFPFAANNHQLTNARYLGDAGAALVFLEEDLGDGRQFAEAILDLFNHPKKLEEMGKKARSLAMPKAGEIIVDEIYQMLGGAR